ncbi:hypothetical protein K456DRAFT_1009323 [Colletotrichum gloeosporioides 23]|nr:hypothetical protein K456DRAFT_1009323 [Colletotrichum gloeosporioides 23]
MCWHSTGIHAVSPIIRTHIHCEKANRETPLDPSFESHERVIATSSFGVTGRAKTWRNATGVWDEMSFLQRGPFYVLNYGMGVNRLRRGTHTHTHTHTHTRTHTPDPTHSLTRLRSFASTDFCYWREQENPDERRMVCKQVASWV